MRNSISFRLWGRFALFTDPITKLGGEKFSYHIPTYEAIKGVLKSIYWKPTFIWYVNKVRIMKPIRTQTKSTKPIKWTAKENIHDLAIYTFLHDVEYQIEAYFDWNYHRPELEKDRIEDKHYAIAKRALEKGGRQDIFLGTRDCQGYVESCHFGEGEGYYDDIDELSFGLMFHSFAYPDETGDTIFGKYFWTAAMKKGILQFPEPKECGKPVFIRKMYAKSFTADVNLCSAAKEEVLL